MLRIALTGGIASGKSTVARLFEDLGAPVVRTDEISRQVVRPGSEGLRTVVATFGEDMLDAYGKLDRGKVRRLIFSDEHRRKDLESILHPLIAEEVARQLGKLEAAGEAYAIVEIPLLVETDTAARYDRILVVDCDPAIQLQRLRRRDHVDADNAKAALAAQVSREQRLAIADDVIDNSNTSMDDLRNAVQSLHETYTASK